MFIKKTLAMLVIMLAFPVNGLLAVSVTQTLTFPTIEGFPDYREMRLEASNWDAPFPFSDAGQITEIEFDFTSTDADFTTGTGPTGGESGVAVRLSNELSSVVPGNQILGYDPTVQPRFAILTEMLADGALDVELHGFENFPVGGFSQALELDEPSSLIITVEGPLGTVTQTRQFPTLPGDHNAAGRMRFDPSGWSAAFPFSSASDIERLQIEFTTTDPDFNTGIGPNGGDPGVAIQVLKELSSVVPGNQSLTLNNTSFPEFSAIAEMLAEGTTIAGLAGFEGFPTLSLPLVLDEASMLTVTVRGVPEPAGVTLLVLGTLLVWGCHRSRWQ